MRRFILFCGPDYYPGGGWSDFHSAYDTLVEADEVMERLVKADWATDHQWGHIVDSQNGEIVKKWKDK